jgi:hypothetical protein
VLPITQSSTTVLEQIIICLLPLFVLWVLSDSNNVCWVYIFHQSEEPTPERSPNYRPYSRGILNIHPSRVITRSRSTGIRRSAPVIVSPDTVEVGSSRLAPIMIPSTPSSPSSPSLLDDDFNPVIQDTPLGFDRSIDPYENIHGSVGSESPYSSECDGKFCCFSICCFQICCFQICCFSICCFSICCFSICCFQICCFQICCFQICCFQICCFSICCFQICCFQICCFQICCFSICCFRHLRISTYVYMGMYTGFLYRPDSYSIIKYHHG